MKFLLCTLMLALLSSCVSTTAQSDLLLSKPRCAVRGGGSGGVRKHNTETYQGGKLIDVRTLDEEVVLLETNVGGEGSNASEDDEDNNEEHGDIAEHSHDNDEDNEDSDDEDDKKKKRAPKRRECKISEDRDEVDFECKSKIENEEDDSEIEDQIEYNVKASGNGVRIKVEYEQEIDNADVESESETQFEVLFDRIVEYVKVNPNATGEELAYDWENDQVIQTIEFRNLNDFSAIETDDDGVVSHFSVSTENGIVAFTFTVSRAAQGEAATANKMKIDFRLAGFPWNRTDSYVALLSEVESEREMKVEYEHDDDDKKKGDSADIDENEEKGKSRKAKDIVINFEEVLNISGFTPFGEYTWAETAEVTTVMNNTMSVILNRTINDLGTVVAARSGGTLEEGLKTEVKTVSVVATSATSSERRLNGKSSQMIAFSFVGDGAHSAPDLFWDPEAGVSYDTSSDESAQGDEDSNLFGGTDRNPLSGPSSGSAALFRPFFQILTTLLAAGVYIFI